MKTYVLKRPVDEAVSRKLSIDYAAALNSQQLAAVTAGEGPSLVIAGAGSGKTRTLVYRAAYLIDSGIDPSKILLLTFTRKSSQEMLERAGELIGVRSERSNKKCTGSLFWTLLKEFQFFFRLHLSGFPLLRRGRQSPAEECEAKQRPHRFASSTVSFIDGLQMCVERGFPRWLRFARLVIYYRTA